MLLGQLALVSATIPNASTISGIRIRNYLIKHHEIMNSSVSSSGQ